MKASGGTSRPSSVVHRHSSSPPTIGPVRRSSTGWMQASSAPMPTARRSSRSRSKRVSTAQAHVVVEHPDLAGTGRLGVVHGHVGVAQLVERVLVARLEPGHADGGRHGDGVVLEGDRHRQRVLDPLGETGHDGDVAGLLGEHDELVAAVAGDEVGVAGGLHEPLGDPLEHDVADPVAEGVVDRLEPVEVDEQQAEPLARPLGPRRGPVELGHQAGPVGEAR